MNVLTGTTSAGMGSTVIMLVLMIAIFYFMLIRPESKRKKQAEEMRSSLQKGDWLTTIGGVYGRVVSITARTVVIETSEDRVRVEFLKSAIGQVGTLDQQAAAQQPPLRQQPGQGLGIGQLPLCFLHIHTATLFREPHAPKPKNRPVILSILHSKSSINLSIKRHPTPPCTNCIISACRKSTAHTTFHKTYYHPIISDILSI